MINEAIKTAGAYMQTSQANDKPAIREQLNIMLDNAEKQGHEVNYSYNQDLAVKRVSNLIKARK